MTRQHARFWKYDGNHSGGHNCFRYDPHEKGLDLIATMAYVAETEYSILGVSLDGVVAKHHKGDDFGHQVHVAATADQWDAVAKYMALEEEAYANEHLPQEMYFEAED